MRRSITLLSLALLACGPPKSGDDTLGEDSAASTVTDATIGHSSTPTTTGPMAGSDDEGPPATTLPPTSTTLPPDPTTSTSGPPPTTTESFTTGVGVDSIPIFPRETDGAFIIVAADLPPGDCSPWLEDCPPGQKCMPVIEAGEATWNVLLCAPVVVDPAPVGAPCVAIGHVGSGLDSCEEHAMCWDVDEDLHGTCVALCVGDTLDQQCEQPEHACVMANGGVLPVCLPECDPLLAACPEGQVCIPAVAEFACAPDASGALGGLFTDCAAGNTCDPGLVCATSQDVEQCNQASDECCLALCDLQEPTCPQGQACQEWFDGLPEYGDVGFCRDL